MPNRRSTLKYAAAALIFLPILSFSQNGPAGTQGSDKPGSKPGTTSGNQSTSTAPVGGGKAGPPKDLGEAWDSLKLDSKARVKLSFRNANIDNILMLLMKASHVTIVKDPSLNGSLTVMTADFVGLSEAFHVFNTVLKMKGFELTRDKKLLIISPVKKAPPPAPPQPAVVTAPPPPPPPPANDNPIVKFYPITYASAQQVARAINDVFSSGAPPQGQPFPQPQPNGRPGAGGSASVRASYEEFSNSVIVHAPPNEQTEVADLIKQIDKSQKLPEHSKTYPLEFAVATEVVSTVQNVLQANLTKGRGSKDSSSNNGFPFFFFFGGQDDSQNLVVADSRTNSLIVTGTDELLKIADQIIADLDHETPVVSTTFVFPLQNARADTVANLLTSAFGPRQGAQNNGSKTTTVTPTNNQFNNSPPGTGSRPGGSSSDVGPNDQNLALKMQDPNASTGDLLTSVGVTQGFFFGGQDGGGGGGRRGGNGQTVGHGRNGKVTNIHDLTGQVTAVADPNTNSIIIVTSPDNADLVKDVIDQLDKIPEQVMIQTIVVEATLDRSKQFGLEWSFSHQIGNTSNTDTATQGFGLQNANPPLQGFNYALTGGDLTAFFNMLQTDTKFQVLSTPRIFTSNNMESQINISQSIPYVLSTFENINGTNSFNYAFQDVGIVLTVTPHITSNGYVTMDVLQTANDLQGYTSFNAPIVNQREAETTVSAKDGETIVLGGMIRDQITSTVNKVPLLGDIPFLGNIFRNTSLDHQKTELLVFLTPRVIRDPAEAKKLKDESQNALSPELKGMMKDSAKSTKTVGKGQ